jgi:hypothetical protein
LDRLPIYSNCHYFVMFLEEGRRSRYGTSMWLALFWNQLQPLRSDIHIHVHWVTDIYNILYCMDLTHKIWYTGTHACPFCDRHNIYLHRRLIRNWPPDNWSGSVLFWPVKMKCTFNHVFGYKFQEIWSNMPAIT